MRFSLIGRLGMGNAEAVANAAQDAARRRREDDEIDRLIAAVARRDAALQADVVPGTAGLAVAPQKAS